MPSRDLTRTWKYGLSPFYMTEQGVCLFVWSVWYGGEQLITAMMR